MNNIVKPALDIIAPKVYAKINNRMQKAGNALLGLCFEVSYSDCVSNSHSCPRGGVTNWNKDPSKPMWYKGLTGRVWARYSRSPEYFGSDVFRHSGCHTGSGGYGSYNGPWDQITGCYWRLKKQLGKREFPFHGVSLEEFSSLAPTCYSWGCKMFLDDWPGTLDLIENALMLAKLSGDLPQHTARWIAQSASDDDQQILKLLQLVTNGVSNEQSELNV